MKNWQTTVAGVMAAMGLALAQQEDPTLKVIGQVLSVIATAILGIVAKQYNVTGGSVPQATPPGIAEKSINQGIIDTGKTPCELGK